MVGSGPWHRDHTPPHPHTRMLHARAASETERPWKTLKMAQIYDFPPAARAEHGHGAKKVLAGVRFQWTDTQNDICIGRADKFSAWEPLLEPSKPFLLLLSSAALCDDVKIVTKIRCDQEEVSS